ncbi:MAG: hypothetical protein M1820_002597 [Bogoriella megaspora]|nr:MAG: hypothetical protein M1820_002597 [Bogoriella megaspora]
MATSMHYSYRALETPTTIRLLRLASVAQQDDQAESAGERVWDIEHIDLDEDYLPEYISISYTWGEYRLCVPLRLKDSTVILTSRNASDALNFNAYEPGDYVWLDQVCINQTDVTERNAQVRLMARIYGQSLACFIWLGRQDEESSDVFSIIDELAEGLKNVYATDEFLSLFPNDHTSIRESLKVMEPAIKIPALDDKRWPALIRFLHRPWFSRMWTFQEAVAPDSFAFNCGDRIIEFSDLHAAALTIGVGYPWDVEYPLARDCFVPILNGRNALRSRRAQPLEDLLLLAHSTNRSCHDQHDRIYSLLGLVRYETMIPIEINYDSSVEDLYTTVTKAIIEDSGSLQILCLMVDQLDTKVGSLPSWVFDWTTPSGAMTRIERWQTDDPFFHASQGRSVSDQVLKRPPESQELIVYGRLCDRVTEVSYLKQGENYTTAALRFEWLFNEVYPTLRTVLRRKDYLSSGQIRNKIFQTLFVHEIHGSSQDHDFKPPTIVERLNELFSIVEEDSETLSKDISEAWHSFSPELARWLRSLGVQLVHGMGRRFAVLEKYFFGLCPGHVVGGDVIAILHGMSVPAVLRKDGDKYHFIGPCLVDGMMFGEACDWAEDEADTFVLI